MNNPQWKTVLLEIGYSYTNPDTGTVYYAQVYNNSREEYTVKVTRVTKGKAVASLIATEKHIKSLDKAKDIALEIIRRYVAKEETK